MTKNHILAASVLMMLSGCTPTFDIHAPSKDLVENDDSSAKEVVDVEYDLSSIISGFDKYRLLYNADCVQEKITNNRGEGYDDLYGTRNFRVVLHGVAYRGGGNNYYHKTDKRGNKNPLPIDGLENLLDNGFSTSVYLYSENFETSPPFLVDEQGEDTLAYYQIGGGTESELDSILMFTYRSIMNNDIGPVYLHCWNGWHQSGYVSAVILKQFCGFDDTKSVHYWEDCADNWTRGYDRIRNSIRDFKPKAGYQISEEIRDAICPCYEDTRKDDTEIYISRDKELKSPNVTILFPSGGAVLPPSVSTFLDEYASMLKDHSFLQVEISGHSDIRGEAQSNLTLSITRAENAYRHLIKQGVDESQLTYTGYGETRTISTEHDKNRRIELSVQSISCQINFSKGKNLISKADKLTLDKIGAVLSSFSGYTIEIGGHADGGSGTDFVNKAISFSRAERVYNYFRDRGFDLTNVTYKGYGTSIPIYNDIRDRRIEFVVHKKDSP
jgi:outer membrane protein OmpA-like peptidoglycan-associated protein